MCDDHVWDFNFFTTQRKTNGTANGTSVEKESFGNDTCRGKIVNNFHLLKIWSSKMTTTWPFLKEYYWPEREPRKPPTIINTHSLMGTRPTSSDDNSPGLHPPQIMDSNTRITLQEDSLRESWPTNENGIGWVQIPQKFLRWEEHIQWSFIITDDVLTTLVRDEYRCGRVEVSCCGSPHLYILAIYKFLLIHSERESWLNRC